MYYTAVGIQYHYSKCLSENAVTKFKDIIPLLSLSSLPCAKTVQSSYLNSATTETDYFITRDGNWQQFSISNSIIDITF